EGADFTTYEEEQEVMRAWCEAAKDAVFEGIAMLVLVDDAEVTAENVNNFVWVTFTKSNPAYDMYGIKSFTRHARGGCEGPRILDARRKPHHAPDLIEGAAVVRRVDLLGQNRGSLYGII